MSVIYNALRKVQERERAPENFSGTGELPAMTAQSGAVRSTRFSFAMTGAGIVAVVALFIGLQMVLNPGESEVGDLKTGEEAMVLRGSDVAVLSLDKQGGPELLSGERDITPRQVGEDQFDEFSASVSASATEIVTVADDERFALEQAAARRERLVQAQIAADDERFALEQAVARRERLVQAQIAADDELLAREQAVARRERLVLEQITARRERLVQEQITARRERLVQEQIAARKEVSAVFVYENDALRPGNQRKQQESKRLKISKVSQKLHTAIALNDEAAVVAGFKELHELTSPDSTFSIKMQAFWSLKKGDDKQSRMLLNEVLKRNPTDVDAGVNMAVMDIRANNSARARRRLEELAITNPRHPAVLSLLEQLGR